jgi:competence protein ComEC
LIDGGPGKTVLNQLNALLPFYDREIDWMILSHPHADHLDGLIAVLEKFDVKNVVTAQYANNKSYAKFSRLIKNEGSKVYIADAQEDFNLSDLKIDILYPFQENTWVEKDLNNQSVALRIVFPQMSFILTGDLELEAENDLIKSTEILQSDIMKAGHHGSKTSNSEKILNKARPKEVVISVGKDNKYNHPHREILDRLNKLGIKIRRTDLEGTICYQPG